MGFARVRVGIKARLQGQGDAPIMPCTGTHNNATQITATLTTCKAVTHAHPYRTPLLNLTY